MAFKDGDLNLPESNNTYPDLLDEVNFGSRFIRGMLPSNGGLASHKVHNHAWSTFVITVEDENESNAAGTRSAMASSTPATLAVARVNAQLARVWSANGGDEGHITNLWNAAKDAWTRVDGTNKEYDAAEASPGPAIGGGDYHDSEINDDRYAAACEMYLTAYALGDGDVGAYKTAVTGSRFFTQMSQWDWATVAGAGTLSLYAVDNDLSLPIQTRIITNILTFADKIKVRNASKSLKKCYPPPSRKPVYLPKLFVLSLHIFSQQLTPRATLQTWVFLLISASIHGGR